MQNLYSLIEKNIKRRTRLFCYLKHINIDICKEIVHDCTFMKLILLELNKKLIY